MKKSTFKFYWEDTLLEMLPSRALFLPETKELLICDIHLGKAEYFQQNGIPLTNNLKVYTHLFYANELGEPEQLKNSRLHSIECACETWDELVSGGWQIVTNKFH